MFWTKRCRIRVFAFYSLKQHSHICLHTAKKWKMYVSASGLGLKVCVLCVKILTRRCSFVPACLRTGAQRPALRLRAAIRCAHLGRSTCMWTYVPACKLCASAPRCRLRAGGWLERVKADNQDEFYDAHASCSLNFYLKKEKKRKKR